MGIICHVGCRKCGRSITVPLGGLELCQGCQDKAMGRNYRQEPVTHLEMISADECIDRISALERINKTRWRGEYWLGLWEAYLTDYPPMEREIVLRPVPSFTMRF